MYELNKSAFGKRTRFDLQNPATGTGFSIVPECGANVLDIRFGGQSILDGYASPDELEAGKWGKSSVLFPFPNRLNGGQYTWLGQTYQFPLNNAATANAIHGFAREEAFEVEYFFLAKDCASIRCSYDYEGQRPYYPFPFALDLEFTIHDDGTFSLEVEVENVHTQPIPVGFGWHPYFRLAERADDHRLHLPTCEQVAIDERMIPTGERAKFADFQRIKPVGDAFLDNCFQYAKASGDYEMALESAEHRLVLNASAKQFPFFQVFTPPHRQSVALEPMTCNVDAFNNQQGLVTLGVGASWKGNMEMRFERI